MDFIGFKHIYSIKPQRIQLQIDSSFNSILFLRDCYSEEE